MNTDHCCQIFSNGVTDKRFSTLAHRCLELAGWLIPSALLVFTPKCPACFAAYIAIGTGLSLSLATAAHLRVILLILAFSSLVLLGAARTRRLLLRLSSVA